MNKTVVTYESFHGSAKKIAEIISDNLKCSCINIDTPFEIEDLKEIENLILVFNFRGPYTAQLTKLYLNRVKDQLKTKNIILVGEGLFSEKEFPIVAEEINKITQSKTFNKFFITGQLRVATLSKEEKGLLDKFSEITGMEIKDMGELDLKKTEEVSLKIEKLLNSEELKNTIEKSDNMEEKETKWVCPICGYVHYESMPPEKCPLCGIPGDKFIKEEA